MLEKPAVQKYTVSGEKKKHIETVRVNITFDSSHLFWSIKIKETETKMVTIYMYCIFVCLNCFFFYLIQLYNVPLSLYPQNKCINDNYLQKKNILT